MNLLMKILNPIRNVMCEGIWLALEGKDCAAAWLFGPLRERRGVLAWWKCRATTLKAEGYSYRDARRLAREWDEEMKRRAGERERKSQRPYPADEVSGKTP